MQLADVLSTEEKINTFFISSSIIYFSNGKKEPEPSRSAVKNEKDKEKIRFVWLKILKQAKLRQFVKLKPDKIIPKPNK